MNAITSDEKQRIIDEEHLRLLTIGHYITGGLYIAFSSLFIFHLAFMLVAAVNPEIFSPPDKATQAMNPSFLYVMVAFIGSFIALGWAFGGLTICAGRWIKKRERRTLSIIVAALNTVFIPVGTILGVFTLIVLNRRTVKALYETGPALALT